MFLHNYLPAPAILKVGSITIHWYGILITIGLILGFFVFYKLALKNNFEKNKIFDLVFWLIIWGIIGGRLYHVLSEISYYFKNPLEIFYVWNGGLGIYGAVLAGVLVVYFFSKKHTDKYTDKTRMNTDIKKFFFLSPFSFLLLDLLVPGLVLAQAIGRWGNYFNQELYGLPSKLPWAIPISLPNRVVNFENFTHFHPVFLYESLFCLGLFIFLLILVKKWSLRDPSTSASLRSAFARDDKKRSGMIFLIYLFAYSTWRFLIEFLRIDSQPEFLSLRLGQWVSLVLIIFSIVFYFRLRKWYNNTEST